MTATITSDNDQRAALPGPSTRARAQMQVAPTDQAFRRAADYLSTISDPIRLRILWWLAQSDWSVTDLCERVGMRQQAVSHHLNILKLRRMVSFHRQGRCNVYQLTDLGRRVMISARALMPR